jgi:hypothetical protein
MFGFVMAHRVLIWLLTWTLEAGVIAYLRFSIALEAWESRRYEATFYFVFDTITVNI